MSRNASRLAAARARLSAATFADRPESTSVIPSPATTKALTYPCEIPQTPGTISSAGTRQDYRLYTNYHAAHLHEDRRRRHHRSALRRPCVERRPANRGVRHVGRG